MDKLNLNQTLRIYIPGLALGILLFFLFREKLNLELNDINFILLPSIFFGFALHSLTINIFDLLFKKILQADRFDKGDFFQTWKYNLIKKLENLDIKNVDLPKKNPELKALYNFVDGIFFCKRYSDSNLIFFRFYKSLGVMFFNIAWSGLIGLILTLLFKFNSVPLLVINIIILPVFLLSSIWFSFYSAKRELKFWLAFSKKELKEVKGLISLWTRIQNDNL